jgi:hypothetical protein
MNLPKFLYAEDLEGDREFVIHNHWPRFTMEFVDGRGAPHFHDPEAEIIALEQKAGREPTVLISRLMREAGDFFAEYHRRLEDFAE